MARKCKVVSVCGKRRRLCFKSNGKIATNTPAGSGGRKAGRRKSSSSGHKAGLKRNGRLRKGCRFAKGGRVVCKKR